jgi:hypothetical protein
MGNRHPRARRSREARLLRSSGGAPLVGERGRRGLHSRRRAAARRRRGGILETVRALTQPEVLAGRGRGRRLRSNRRHASSRSGSRHGARHARRRRAARHGRDDGGDAPRGQSAAEPWRAESAERRRVERQKLDAITGPEGRRPSAPSAPRLAAPSRPAASEAAAHRRAPACATPQPTRPDRPSRRSDGVAFTPDGHLADANAWTRELGETLAAALGRGARPRPTGRWSSSPARTSPRPASPEHPPHHPDHDRSTTKDIYALFPKAPARTIAKIAGIPKPAGCL